MNKPTLQTLLDAKIEKPDVADKFFAIGKEPDAKWLKAIAPGLDVSQRLVDEYFAVAEFDEASGATAAPAEVRPVADMEALAAQIEQLRARVRVAADAPAHEIVAAALAGRWLRRVMMVTPLNGPMNPFVHYAHMTLLRRQPWLGYFQKTSTILQQARNMCVQAFLKSEADFCLMVDGDTVLPCDNPGLFYDAKNGLGANINQLPEKFAKFNAADRLMSHGKSIVGGFYQQRARGGKITSPLDLKPNGDKEGHIKATRRKAQDKIVPVEWCATGCLLVHRRVFEDIETRHPELVSPHENGPFNFFGHDVGNGGEDAWFGKLAAEAGHQSYLDLGCWCGHVGNMCFWPEEVAQ